MSDENGSTPGGASVVRVWDLPTRLFHWLLAAAVVAQLITGNIGGNAMPWHFRVGYLIFALLLFRLVWGVVGGHWSRFASFAYGPSSIVRYLRGRPLGGDLFHVGHNPLGSVSVFAMLVLLAAQVATGLVADDEIANVGPLNRYVSSSVAMAATAWHKGPGKVLIVLLVVLHIGAIVFYRWRLNNNLVRPMLDGDKRLSAPAPASVDDRLARVRALAIVVVCALLVTAVVNLAG
ncbi:MAG: hypothetical protein LKCHEGNO_02404 [Burkholderiaceae bacterium]|nr:hypothetical protein [Burkholderiaceae bacterium]